MAGQFPCCGFELITVANGVLDGMMSVIGMLRQQTGSSPAPRRVASTIDSGPCSRVYAVVHAGGVHANRGTSEANDIEH